MNPNNSVIKGGVPSDSTARVLAEIGKAYAIYLKGGTKAELVLELPTGQYVSEWIDTKMGTVNESQHINHNGGNVILSSPEFSEDIALRILRK
jgi:hypothetical protein